jgi:hypothetical protein
VSGRLSLFGVGSGWLDVVSGSWVCYPRFGSTTLVVSSRIPILGFDCVAAPEHALHTGGYFLRAMLVPARTVGGVALKSFEP